MSDLQILDEYLYLMQVCMYRSALYWYADSHLHVPNGELLVGSFFPLKPTGAGLKNHKYSRVDTVLLLRPNYIYRVLGRDSAFGRVYPSVISPDSTRPSDRRVSE